MNVEANFILIHQKWVDYVLSVHTIYMDMKFANMISKMADV